MSLVANPLERRLIAVCRKINVHSPSKDNVTTLCVTKTVRTNVYFVALGGVAVVTKLVQLACPEADDGDRQQTLPCCQLVLGRQRQQCGLAAANRAAASWRANRLNERRSTKVEWNVQCRLTGEHFEKIIVGNGH